MTLLTCVLTPKETLTRYRGWEEAATSRGLLGPSVSLTGSRTDGSLTGSRPGDDSCVAPPPIGPHLHQLPGTRRRRSWPSTCGEPTSQRRCLPRLSETLGNPRFPLALTVWRLRNCTPTTALTHSSQPLCWFCSASSQHTRPSAGRELLSERQSDHVAGLLSTDFQGCPPHSEEISPFLLCQKLP